MTQGMGTRRYVEDFYRKRREAGLHDLEPANKKAAQYVPAPKLSERKKIKELNNGL